MSALTVVGTGTARATNPAEFARNAPSFFADPVAWLVAAAVEQALATSSEDLTVVSDDVGVVALSRTCSSITMSTIAVSTHRGTVSPLRFAGASPAILAGLTCIRWKFRGPTLTLAMAPVSGLGAAVAVADGWLHTAKAAYVLIATHVAADGVHTARCAAIRGATGPEPDRSPELQWLLGSSRE